MATPLIKVLAFIERYNENTKRVLNEWKDRECEVSIGNKMMTIKELWHQTDWRDSSVYQNYYKEENDRVTKRKNKRKRQAVNENTKWTTVRSIRLRVLVVSGVTRQMKDATRRVAKLRGNWKREREEENVRNGQGKLSDRWLVGVSAASALAMPPGSARCLLYCGWS